MLRHRESCNVRVTGSNGPGPCQRGVCKTNQCAELEDALRGTKEKATHSTCANSILLVRATRCDVAAVRARGVATPVFAAFLRCLRTSELAFRHSTWSAAAGRPNIGLRQGCSLSPLSFRRVIEYCVAEARAAWNSQIPGLHLGEIPLQGAARADDQWLYASRMALIVDHLQQCARDRTGLRLGTRIRTSRPCVKCMQWSRCSAMAACRF